MFACISYNFQWHTERGAVQSTVGIQILMKKVIISVEAYTCQLTSLFHIHNIQIQQRDDAFIPKQIDHFSPNKSHTETLFQ